MKEIYRPVLAAFLARSNIGLDPATPEEVARAVKSKPNRDNAVVELCGSFCENESMLRLFQEEAVSFEEHMFKGLSDDRIREMWPHHAAAIEACTVDT